MNFVDSEFYPKYQQLRKMETTWTQRSIIALKEQENYLDQPGANITDSYYKELDSQILEYQQYAKALFEDQEKLKQQFAKSVAALNDGSPIMGRPAIGVTKKQSLTLQDETWQWIDNAVYDGIAGSRSEFLRDIIEFARTGR